MIENYYLITIIRYNRRTALCIRFVLQVPIQEPNLALSCIYATPTSSYLSVRDRKRDGGPRQRVRGSPIHVRIAPCTAKTANTDTATATATGGRPGTPELESVSRSIWDKVRRFCAPRFAETLESRSHGEPAALSLRPFCRVHSQIVTPTRTARRFSIGRLNTYALL